MKKQQLLLPMHNVQRNRAKRSSKLNEKTLIVALLIVSVFSLFFILRNLPAHVPSSLGDDEVRGWFVPKINRSRQEEAFVHGVGGQHDRWHHRKIVPSFDNDLDKEDRGTENKDKNRVDTNKNDANEVKNKERRDKVKEMTLFAWNNYKKYAWGKNELKPLSRTGHQAGIFGGAENLGASIVDAMDTLHLMGLHDEVKLGKEWIQSKFNLNIGTQLSAFEVNIRFVGGFLAMFTLTKDKFYLNKAEEVATLLLPIFQSPTGIPYSLVNPASKQTQNYNWAAGGCSILAELGSLSLEFQYLSDATGNRVFEEKINKLNEALEKANRPEGLYYNYINPTSGAYCGTQAGVGGLADSFYEYLLKLWLYKNKSDKKLLEQYLTAMRGVRDKLIRKSANNFVYAGEYSSNQLAPRMGHLACFTGGMFALTAMYVEDLPSAEKIEYENLARNITYTCHQSYQMTATKLGPESFSFYDKSGPSVSDRYYILRPETVESYFYLWRMTKEEKYRDWAWEVVQALEKHCRTEAGYSGVRDVNQVPASLDDVQQSFFFAETLKYLYLIFSDDDLVPLGEYVFNTEAHAFVINKKNG